MLGLDDEVLAEVAGAYAGCPHEGVPAVGFTDFRQHKGFGIIHRQGRQEGLVMTVTGEIGALPGHLLRRRVHNKVRAAEYQVLPCFQKPVLPAFHEKDSAHNLVQFADLVIIEILFPVEIPCGGRSL